MSHKLRLVEVKGPTQIQIDVEITEEGDLLFSGQDIGETPRQVFGDSDYEYWLRISAADKDRVLIALVEKLFTGNTLLISELRKQLDAKAIPYAFDSYA